MANRLNPGIGEGNPALKRLATTERFIGQFKKTQILASTPEGKPWLFEVLAAVGAPGAEATAVGAFFAVYKDTKKGGWVLQGGQVTAGNKSEVLDHVWLVKTGSEPKDGHLHWLTITGDGLVTTGRLQGEFNLTKVTDGHGEKLPDITLPTKDSPKGRAFHLLLGSWQGKRFQPAQTGNIGVTFCPGQGYTIHRGT